MTILKDGVYRIINNAKALDLFSTLPGVWELLVVQLYPDPPYHEWTVTSVSKTKPWYQIFNAALSTYPVPLNNGVTGLYLAGAGQPHAEEGWEIQHVSASSFKVIWHTSDVDGAHLWTLDPDFPLNIRVGTDDGSDDSTWTFERIRDLDG